MNQPKENLFKAIESIIQSIPMPFDQTKIGRVAEKTSNTEYTVEIQGEKYQIKSNFQFAVDERVFVLFPCGNRKEAYLLPNK